MRSSGRTSQARNRRGAQPSAQSNVRRSGQLELQGSHISNHHHDRRRMEHIASVSRSSGLEKDGDS